MKAPNGCSVAGKGQATVRFRNRGESMAYGNLETAQRMIAECPTWVWLLPWKISTWCYLRRVVRMCRGFLVASGREDIL